MLLGKLSSGRWFGTLWRSCCVTVMLQNTVSQTADSHIGMGNLIISAIIYYKDYVSSENLYVFLSLARAYCWTNRVSRTLIWGAMTLMWCQCKHNTTKRDSPCDKFKLAVLSHKTRTARHFRWPCAKFADMSSSMEFYGIPGNLECANFVDVSVQFHGISWNSMELGVRQFRWHEHGIPWIPPNLKCANFTDTSSSMEFHGTWTAPISMTRAVQWNSTEFHITSGAQISMTRAVPWNSMELEVRQFRWHKQFHGILWNAMEFHGAWGVPISMTQAVPWNSMEPLLSSNI